MEIEKEIKEYLEKNDYDIRKTNDARWIDQKCTYDVIYIIMNLIQDYINCNKTKEFTISSIWSFKNSSDKIQDYFNKPDTNKSLNEYDKFFSQPIKLLSYSKLLNYKKDSNKYIFWIENENLFRKISEKQENVKTFLTFYIEKVLKDSDIWKWFEIFFENQDIDTFNELKSEFISFTIKNTKIKGKIECGRIFTKILNPLANKRVLKGTRKGRMSKTIITNADLIYNRTNFRDDVVQKDKNIPRSEYIVEEISSESETQKAKNTVKQFNKKYNDDKSEVYGQGDEYATQIHHIFSRSSFPKLTAFLENLIALTPNQHYQYAHPGNNTQVIDKKYQYICLLAKIREIKNAIDNNEIQSIYDYKKLIEVLNVGLKTNVFDKYLNQINFDGILNDLKNIYENYINSMDSNFKKIMECNKDKKK